MDPNTAVANNMIERVQSVIIPVIVFKLKIPCRFPRPLSIGSPKSSADRMDLVNLRFISGPVSLFLSTSLAFVITTQLS